MTKLRSCQNVRRKELQRFFFNEIGLLKYQGTIDDNYENESEVKIKYVEEAIESLISGRDPGNNTN